MRIGRTALLGLALLSACSPKGGTSGTPASEAAHPSVAATPPQSPPAKSVVLLTGSVDAANAAHFTKFVSDNLDAVVGVKIDVSPSDDEDFERQRYLASADDDMLAIFKGDGEHGGIEVVVPKGSYGWQHGHHTVDGFFVVKSGGMHQGTLSYGLTPTDEGVIRTNPGVRIVEQELK
jgi:hypothetical protein